MIEATISKLPQIVPVCRYMMYKTKAYQMSRLFIISMYGTPMDRTTIYP
jgi:hypothetical protein